MMKRFNASSMIIKSLKQWFAPLCTIVGAALFASVSYAASNSPKGYVEICRYGQTCALIKPSLVAFGGEGEFVYKIMRGTFECSERSFNRLPEPGPSSTYQCSIAIKREPTDSAATQPTFKDGQYIIRSSLSGKVLSIDSAGHIKQVDYSAEPHQHFLLHKRQDGYVTLQAANSGALTLENWQLNDGAQLVTEDGNDQWNQQWQLRRTDDGNVAIISRYSGKALDLVDLNKHNSAKVRLWTYWGGDNQHWQLIAVDDFGNQVNF